MRRVESGGLVLEPQLAEHAPEMFELLRDPALYTHEGAPPVSLDWLRARFQRLESRRSGDGSEQWLNWVIRRPDGRLAGYVQATLRTDGLAAVAYELGHAHWGQGIGRQAVQAMIDELAGHHRVRHLYAVLKRSNQRSRHLLDTLGFTLTTPSALRLREVGDDEWVMQRHLE